MSPNLLGGTTLLLAGVEESSQNRSVQIQESKSSSSFEATVISTRVKKSTKDEYKWDLVWRNIFGMLYLHIGGVYGLYTGLFVVKWSTMLWGIFIGVLASVGVTAGAHRLWAHRAYKATWQLRITLMVMQTICFQNHIYEWVRDHRVHHKFTDTDADPHNSKRGFFFSHMGWLLVRKHNDVKEKGKIVDMTDLLKDPIVVFQKKTYLILMPLLCFVMPTVVPWYFWKEDWWAAWYYCAIFRYVLSLHFTWLVNSAAHFYGYKPYDRTISPTENKTVSLLTAGEGWHNYHHVFPWDYKAAELPTYGRNWSLGFINQMAKIGWAYDLKTVPSSMVAKRAARTGDGSHCQNREEQLWGWGDTDMQEEDLKFCEILHKKSAQ